MAHDGPERYNDLSHSYYAAPGGHPDQSQLLTGRAVFTEAYAFIPRGVERDITTSYLPFWEKTRLWVLARPMSGFAETFSQYLMEVAPGGGSEQPEADAGAEAAMFFVSGDARMVIAGTEHDVTSGGFVFIPAGTDWTIRNTGETPLRFHWLRKTYQEVPGLPLPDPIIVNEDDITPDPMPGAEDRWTTTRFMDPADLRYDMHITIVTLYPGAVIPFMETHVMEHGLYILEGKGVYKLNRDWVEVEEGDFMWLRAFCPQACYAGGSGPFRYLLYKDVNRHVPLSPLGIRGA